MDLALFKELISCTYEKEWLEMPTSIITTMNLTIPNIYHSGHFHLGIFSTD